MKPHGNGTSVRGLRSTTIDRKLAMRVYDALPPIVRREVAEAPFKVGVLSVQDKLDSGYPAQLMAQDIRYTMDRALKREAVARGLA